LGKALIKKFLLLNIYNAQKTTIIYSLRQIFLEYGITISHSLVYKSVLVKDKTNIFYSDLAIGFYTIASYLLLNKSDFSVIIDFKNFMLFFSQQLFIHKQPLCIRYNNSLGNHEFFEFSYYEVKYSRIRLTNINSGKQYQVRFSVCGVGKMVSMQKSICANIIQSVEAFGLRQSLSVLKQKPKFSGFLPLHDGFGSCGALSSQFIISC
jgi:hypothetical protein